MANHRWRDLRACLVHRRRRAAEPVKNDHPPSSEMLLASAVHTLTKSDNTFTFPYPGAPMSKALAKTRQTEMKAATKRIRARKTEQPESLSMADILAQAQATESAAVDSTPDPVVKSGYSVFQQEVQAVTDHSDQKAAKAAEREAAKAARDAAKAAAAAEKQAKAEARAQAQAAKESEKQAKAQARAAARAAKEAAAAEAAQSGVYAGSMLALRDARARYVKAMNGRLRSTDDIAIIFDAVEPKDVVAIALQALQLGANPYTRLNIGQQSMNLRNRLRGALKKGIVTLDAIRQIRDDGGYTNTVETRLAEAQARREARAAKAAAQVPA